jgi:hypothetical protein
MQTQDIMNIICEAHQNGQTFSGCKHPSWSEAFAYWKSVEEKFKSINSAMVPCDKVIEILRWHGPASSKLCRLEALVAQH